jgi:hypothetical protein
LVKPLDLQPQRLLLEKVKRHPCRGLRPQLPWAMANSKKPPEQGSSAL